MNDDPELRFSAELLEVMKAGVEDNVFLRDGRFHRALKLTIGEAKDLVKEAMQARGWSDLTLLLDESAAAAIREDVIDIRFESGRFSDRDAADDEEDAFDSDDLWEGVRAWSRVADEEADIAVMAVVLDHLLVLLGDKDEVAVHVPKPSWKN